MNKGQTNETPRVGINRWNFSGTVVRKNFKYSKEGNLFGSVMLRVPAQNEKFTTTLWLKVFNGKENNLADQVNESVADGTNWSFYGYVSTSSFEKDGKKEYRTDFIITRFVPAEASAPKTESSTAQTKDEVPF